MNVNTFLVKCAQFFHTHILPTTFPKADDSVIRAIASGAAGLLAFRGTQIINKHQDALKMLGVMSDAGEIDTEALKTFLYAAFDGQERVTVKTLPLVPEMVKNSFPGLVAKYADHTWNFTRADADKFLGMLAE